VVAHTFNPSTWEAEAGGFLSWGQPGLQSEFQDSQGCTEKPCLEKPKKKKKKKKGKENSHYWGGKGETGTATVDQFCRVKAFVALCMTLSKHSD